MKTLVCFGDSITADEKDGLHFGPQGYEYLAKIIGEKLKGFCKKQSVGALLFLYFIMN